MMDRRQLLGFIGALVASSALPGCSRDDGKPDGGGAGAAGARTDTEWERLRAIRAAIRASPDHLGSLAAVAVATKNADTIVEFVARHITVLPPTSAGASSLTDARWGHAATLRAGAGTLRERADLLVDLLTRAGYTAAVHGSPTPPGLTPARLYAPAKARFEPDTKVLEAVAAALKVKLDPISDQADRATDAELSQTVDQLLALLPKELRTATAAPSGLPDQLPVVRFERDAKVGWATLLGEAGVSASAPAGESGVASATMIPTVSITVSVALNPPPGSTTDRASLHEVASGTWPADIVAGRSVVLAFPPPLPARQLIGTDFRFAPVRVPMLALQGIGDNPKDLPSPKVKALVVTSGDLLVSAADDPAHSAGPYAATTLDSTARQALRTKAAKVVVRASAASFPEIDLSVSVTAKDGSSLNGLGVDDFVVAEGGQRQRFTLTSNTVPPGARVLVVYDTSSSVTDAWRTRAARAAFEASLSDALTKAAAAAPFVVQVVGVGDTPRADAWAVPAASALSAALGSVISDSSIWLSMGGVVPASGAAAVVLVSDNVSSLEDPERVLAWHKSLRAAGVPVATIPVGKVDRAATQLITTLSGGIELAPTAPDLSKRLADFIRDRVARAAATNYRIRYVAPESGPATRAVSLSIAGNAGARGDATYEVPAQDQRAAPSGVAGIYLTIRVGGNTEVRRLAGVTASDRGIPGDVADRDAITQVAAVLDGFTTIAFEPTGATSAAMLDDAVSALLSAEPMVEAARAKQDGDQIVAAAAGLRRYPGLLPGLLERAGAAKSGPAGPQGLGVVVITETVHGDQRIQEVDIAPRLNRFLGADPDRAAAFRAAMEASLVGSIREGQQFTTSALGALRGQKLVLVPALANGSTITGWTAEQRQRLAPLLTQYWNWHRLVPAAGDVVAMWVVDPETGTTVAVGLDERGGGKSGCTLLPENSGARHAEYFIALIGVTCTAADFDSGTPMWAACIGANTAGAATSAYMSFDNPFGLFMTYLGWGFGLMPIPGAGAAGKAVMIVLGLLLTAMGGIECK